MPRTRSKLLRGVNSEFATTKDVLDYLYQHGHLAHGKIIPTEIFEMVIGIKHSESWDYLGPLLLIREAITDEGFFCSERGLDRKDLRILPPSEVAEHARKREEARKKSLKKDARVMQCTPVVDLEEEKRKLHDFQLRKLNDSIQRLESAIHEKL